MRQQKRPSPILPLIVLAIIIFALSRIPFGGTEEDARQAGEAAGRAAADWWIEHFWQLLGVSLLVLAVLAFDAWRRRRTGR